MKQQVQINVSQGAKVGSVLCSTSYMEGGNWGYLLDSHNDYKTLYPLLNQEKENLKVVKVSNGVVVLANEQFLANTVDSILSPIEKEKAANNQKVRKVNERNKCLKFLESVVQKTTKYGVSYDGFKEYAIGIYSSNTSDKIQVNGIEYPAFKLTIQEILECLVMMLRFCKVYVKTSKQEGVVEFKALEDIKSAPNGLAEVVNGLEIAMTQTGVFLTVRVQ